jgi:hypothetical protein
MNPLPALTDQERASDKELIFEAMQIASGETMKRATNEHLRALLGERSNLIAQMWIAHDGLVDAAESLNGHAQSMTRAILHDTRKQLDESGFLEKLDPKWVQKVL